MGGISNTTLALACEYPIGLLLLDVLLTTLIVLQEDVEPSVTEAFPSHARAVNPLCG
jgi:hypothetical protein